MIVCTAIMQSMTFSLSISADQYLRYYSGHAKFVQVSTDDGRTLKFPANNLQPFITRDGIHGRFEMRFDDNNRIIGLRRIG